MAFLKLQNADCKVFYRLVQLHDGNRLDEEQQGREVVFYAVDMDLCTEDLRKIGAYYYYFDGSNRCRPRADS